ncbi:MAG: 5-methyltetrahydropteroyltriglutamate--homocysteine methyltransferase [Gammaproteobacteria bacterium]|nr:5-methyltetrahydropteroyltriglutamate--homocysteine methyltransferase [Gammaproteobacteria bacterium]
MDTRLLPTTLVGSYPQPDWLVDKEMLLSNAPPRVRMAQVWRVPGPLLEEAQDDATRLVLRDLEQAGVDILTDGEVRRESYFNRFATGIEGIDLDKPGTVKNRRGRDVAVPRVVGSLRRSHGVQVRDVEFLRANTDRPIKITIPGPFTLTQLAQDDYYHDLEALAFAYADVVNEELRELKAAGADVVQLDEPYLQAQPERARELGVAAIDRALAGIPGTTAVHLCFGYAYVVKEKPPGYSYLHELDACSADQISIEAAQPALDLSILAKLPSKTIILGVLDLGTETIETADRIAARIREALEWVAPERLVIAPDCGMKYLPRSVARAKLDAMVAGARAVRNELQS